MREESLYDFYEHVVLPQFGFKDLALNWDGSQRTGPDEMAHYFAVDGTDYALIFEDAGGLGQNDAYIRQYVLEHHSSYSFVKPIAASGSSPSYDGLQLPAPCQYCENITGIFTLLKLIP